MKRVTRLQLARWLIVLLLCFGTVGFALGSVRAEPIKDEYRDANLYIDDYETELEFFRDNRVNVKEKVSVHFNVKRHGVNFFLPWHDRNGEKMLLSGVKANHFYYDFRAFRGDSETLIFGNPFKKDSTPKVYELHYTYQLGNNQDVKENVIYWNIIGTNRPYYHAKVYFKLKLPMPVEKDAVHFYVGKEGATSEGRVEWKQMDDGTIVGKIIGDLAPKEAVTVRIDLPQGYYQNVRGVNPILYFFKRYVRWYDLLVLLFIPLSYLSYKRKGKEPPVVETVEFYPPANTNPAEAAYLYYADSVVGDFAPLVVSWADQGALHIQELPHKDTRFYRRVNYPVANQYEQNLFIKMFQNGDGASVRAQELKEVYYPDLRAARNSMMDTIDGGQGQTPRDRPAEKKALKSQRRLAFLMSLIPFGILLTTQLYRGLAEGGGWTYGIIVALVGLWFHRRTLLALPPSEERRKVHTKKFGALRMNGPQKLFTVIVLALIGLIMWDSAALTAFILYMIVLLYMGSNVRKIDRRTEFGRWYLGKLGGFRNFIRAAELDRIRMLVAENPNYFYHVLPYAMNLGITDAWIGKFKMLALPPPVWFSSEGGDFGADDDLPERLVSTVNNAQSFMTHAPRVKVSDDSSSDSGSDSSSSGGSAGGGSGGSGMGDW